MLQSKKITILAVFIISLFSWKAVVSQVALKDTYLILFPSTDRTVSITTADKFRFSIQNYLDQDGSLNVVPNQAVINYFRTNSLDRYGFSSPDKAVKVGEELGANLIITSILQGKDSRYYFTLTLLEASTAKTLTVQTGSFLSSKEDFDFSILWDRLIKLIERTSDTNQNTGKVSESDSAVSITAYPYSRYISKPVSDDLSESFVIEGIEDIVSGGNLAFWYSYFGKSDLIERANISKALIHTDYLFPDHEKESKGTYISTYREGIQIMGLSGLTHETLCELIRRGLPVAIFDYKNKVAADGTLAFDISFSLGGFAVNGAQDNVLEYNGQRSRFKTGEIYKFYRQGYLTTGYRNYDSRLGPTYIINLGPKSFEGRIPSLERRMAYLLLPQSDRKGGYSRDEIIALLQAKDKRKNSNLYVFSVPQLFYLRKGDIPEK